MLTGLPTTGCAVSAKAVSSPRRASPTFILDLKANADNEMIKRHSTKQETRRSVDRQAKGLRGGAYDGPHINKDCSDITQVRAYEPGHKGKQQKSRPKWPY